MAIGTNHSSAGLQTDINVTPLIDVLLVLLIIFMVIVPVAPRGLEAQLPVQAKDSKQNPESATVVQIISRSGSPTYKMNQDDVPITQLGRRLSAIFSARADKVIFIQGDGNLDFSAVAQVLDIARQSGAEHIGLITRKPNAL